MSAPAFTISHAENEEAVQRCHPVMVQLRPHLSLPDFTDQVQRQQLTGYRLAYADRGGFVVAVAGYRFLETLAWGRHLYIDDLVTDEAQRSTGAGSALFDHLMEVAKENDCRELHLDSGVQRFGAHRFYLAKRMDITAHHFAVKLG
ncbi:GNAT family N-acetyltransferase [soil metagenome]